VADQRARIQREASAVLQPGEPILAAVRATTQHVGVGALGGLLMVLALSVEQRNIARDSGFPAATNMLLAATDRRLLVFRRGSFSRSGRFLADIQFGRLRRVSMDGQGLNKGLRFVFDTGASVAFTTYRTDHPDRFIETVNRAIDTRLALVPPIPPRPTIPLVLPPPPPG